jgi:predicted dehydrogenase
MGKADATNAANHGDIVAVCDVDDSHAAAAAEEVHGRLQGAGAYSDFRKLLERSDIHAVVNATPDHWHSLVNIAAARAGKDVYSEKPLTLTIGEGRRVVEAVRKHGIVLQTGTQQRSSQRFRLACELVRNERIGKLRQAEVWLPAGLREGPFTAAPVPQGLNWDFWLGQAPQVDYVPQRCHTFFRYWYDYSGGTMTDWGAHHNDIAYWAIGLVAPREVEGRALSEPIPGGYTAFAEYDVRYTYANGVGILRIHDHGTTTSSAGPSSQAGQHNGIRFEGIRRLDLGQPQRDHPQATPRCSARRCPRARCACRQRQPHGEFLRLRPLAPAADLRRRDGPPLRDHLPPGGDRPPQRAQAHLGFGRRAVHRAGRGRSRSLPHRGPCGNRTRTTSAAEPARDGAGQRSHPAAPTLDTWRPPTRGPPRSPTDRPLGRGPA